MKNGELETLVCFHCFSRQTVPCNFLLILSFVTWYGFVGRWLSPGRDTVSALDFGGASAQITFETTDVVEDKTSWIYVFMVETITPTHRASCATAGTRSYADCWLTWSR